MESCHPQPHGWSWKILSEGSRNTNTASLHSFVKANKADSAAKSDFLRAHITANTCAFTEMGISNCDFC